MALNLGDILSGLSASAQGAEQGIASRKELERQARIQLLQEQLAQQKFGLERQNITSEIQRRADQTAAENERNKIMRDRPPAGQVGKYVPEQDPVTGEWNYIWHPGAGETPPGASTSDQHPPIVASGGKTHPKPQLPVLAYDQTGGAMLVNRGNATARPVAGVAKPLTPVERTAGSQVESASGSVDVMQQIAARNPGAVQEAIGAIKAGHIPIIGGLVGEARGALTSADAQTFYENYKNFLLSVTPTYGGARPTKQLLDLEESATLPALTSGDFTTAFATMQHRLNDLRAKAGRASPSTPNPQPPSTAPKKPAVNSRYWKP